METKTSAAEAARPDSPTHYDLVTTMYRLPNSEAVLLNTLLRRVLLPIEVIVELKLACNPPHARVIASKLRKFLKSKNIVLHCKPKVGYWLDPEDKQKIFAEIEARRTAV